MVIFHGISVVVVVDGFDACLLSMVRAKACFVIHMGYNVSIAISRSSSSTIRKVHAIGVVHSRLTIGERGS